MEQKNWEIDDKGMIIQTMSDTKDSDIRLFTETAKNHNQAIQDSKEQPKPKKPGS
jgi:hypothetical protein